jgi:hypothetical protein
MEALPAAAFEAPIGDIEETIARIWQELLGIERVGRNDRFFEIGGHSLLAVRMQERLAATFDRPIPVIKLFIYTTIAQQSAWIADPDRDWVSGTDSAQRRGQARRVAMRERSRGQRNIEKPGNREGGRE